MYLVLGDWSDDGHGKYEKVLMESNLPVKDVQKAYKKACKLTGVSFNGSDDDFTGVDREWEDEKDYQVATEYEEPILPLKAFNLLEKHGLTSEMVVNYDPDKVDGEFAEGVGFRLNEPQFINLWIWFVKLGNPELDIKRVDEKDEIPCINGFWNKNLNVQFGYGLYD